MSRSYSRSWSSVVWGGYQLTVQAEELVRKVSEVLDDWRSAELDLLGILGDSVAAYAVAWPAPVLRAAQTTTLVAYDLTPPPGGGGAGVSMLCQIIG